MKALFKALFKASFIALISIFILSGCTTYHRTVLKISEEDVKNTEISEAAARLLLLTWDHRSGKIHGYLQQDIAKVPFEAITIIGKLDKLAEKESYTSRELGEARSMIAKLIVLGTSDFLKKHGINILSIMGIK